jgi:hypothetical protein
MGKNEDVWKLERWSRMAKSAYQLWKEAKEKETQRKTEGKVHFKEDSRASRVRTTLPQYEGKSKDKNYKWESDLLKPLSIKQYGRSYNDKFDKWSKSQGLNPERYRNEMDFEEDRKKEGHYAYGAMYESEVFDGIFKDLETKTKQSYAANTKRSQEKKVEETKKKQVEQKKKTIKKDDISLLDDIKAGSKSFVQALNPFDDVSFDQAFKEATERQTSKAFDEITRGSNRAVDSASLGVMSNLDKKVNNRQPYYNSQREFGEGGGADMLTTGLGYLVPGIGGYKALNATKVGKALTQFGSKGIGQRLASEGAKGALIGAGMSGTEVAAREGLNPDDYNWKQNLGYVGINTGIGAVADPLLYGAGKAIGKGFETAANRTMRNLLPSNGQVEEALKGAARASQGDTALPIVNRNLDNLIPRGNDIANPNFVPPLVNQTRPQVEVPRVGRPLDEALANPKPDPELEAAIQEQYEYLKNSMGKGVEYGSTGGGGLGNFKEVNGGYRISNNPKWYQDFYAQNGRKPTNAELRELAEQHVREGFQDEVGDIPAWSPQNVREIDQEIADVVEMIRQSPEQEEALQPILAALKEDRELALQEAGLDSNKQYQYMRASRETAAAKPLPDNIQAMQNEIVPLRQPSGKKVKPITRQELLNNTRKNLGVTLRHGRLGPVDDNVSGYFKTDAEVIRTRNYGDVGVISHEIGHHLDKQFKLTDPAFDGELLKLGRVTSGADYTTEQIRDEGLAEFIRLYLSDPQQALVQAPKFSQHFETALPAKVKKGLLKTQSDMDRWIEQGPEMRLRGKIDRTGRETTNIGEKVDKLYTQFVDKFDRLKKVEKAVTGKINSAEQSLYKKARLSAGAPKKAEMELREFKSILAPIEKYGYNMKDVSDYATAVHARELEALDIESGMTKEEVEKVIAKFDTPEMKQVHAGLMKYNNKLLDMLQQGQVLSKEAVDAMKQKYPNYVPFYRFFEDDIAQGLGGNKGFTNLTNPVKRLKGSTRDVIDPLESMIKNTFAVVNAVEKNKVGLELSRLADIEGVGRFVERLHGKQEVKKEHIVTVFENGEKVQYQLDKDLYEAIQQLDEDVTNKVIQLLSVPTSMLRAGATLTPEFMLRNPIRDQFQAFVVSNYGYNPIIDLPMGLVHVIKGKATNSSKFYKEWVDNGGGYGNYLSQDRNYLRETLDHLHKEGNKFQRGFKTVVNPKEWIKILQAMSELTEEATKVGEFRRARKKGASPQEAAFQSRDLMDFARVGTDMKQWNRAVAFLNANLQGKDKIARAFKHNPVRTTVRAVTGVTIPAIGAYMAMEHLANEKQKETFANTPKWMKDTFFILPIPGTDELARIPKPFDLAPVFANPVQQVMDYVKGNEPDEWDEFLKRQAISISSIPHMLTGLAPIIENVTNYSFFTGGPVVPRRDQDLLPEDQYGVTTSLTARTVGKLTGTSPYKVDNLIRGYGAGLGKYATSGMDNLLEGLNVGTLPPQEQKKWSELPVVNAFTVDSTGGGQVMTDFYDTIDKLTKERNSVKRNQEGYQEGDEVDYPRVDDYKHLTKVSREISDLRNEYRSIQGSYDLSPEQKRRYLDELDRQMNTLAREALIEIGEKKR